VRFIRDVPHVQPGACSSTEGGGTCHVHTRTIRLCQLERQLERINFVYAWNAVYAGCSGCVVFLCGKVWESTTLLPCISAASISLSRPCNPSRVSTPLRQARHSPTSELAQAHGRFPKLSHAKTPHNHCTPRTQPLPRALPCLNCRSERGEPR
jgi:hypothetical protein